MNNIAVKQNEDEMLSLLKLQRFQYNNISKISTLNLILSVVLPIILSIIGLFDLQENVVLYINLIGAVCIFICLFLDTRIKELKNKAAQVQYIFDINLFEWEQNSLISNLLITELISIAQKNKIKSLTGLENWYSVDKNLSVNDAIFSCQQQNIRWDKKLRKKYMNLINIGCSVFVLLIVSFAILSDISFNVLWSYIFLIMPIFTYCIVFTITTKSNLKDQDELINTFNQYKNKKTISNKDLISLEEKIFYYRKDLVKIPNWFFNLYRKEMQEEANNYAKVESELSDQN